MYKHMSNETLLPCACSFNTKQCGHSACSYTTSACVAVYEVLSLIHVRLRQSVGKADMADEPFSHDTPGEQHAKAA